MKGILVAITLSIGHAGLGNEGGAEGSAVPGSESVGFLAESAVGRSSRPSSGGNSGEMIVPLDVPNAGRTGFTLLTAEQTGVAFTNEVDEWSAAANRVLENGSGVAVGDYDQDGRSDIFLCSLKGRSRLFRNRGGMQFEDVTESSGRPVEGRVARGAVFADLNGDRWPELIVSTLRDGVFVFLNDTKGKLIHGESQGVLTNCPGATTLALADVDGNGTLDLYVTRYRADDIRDRARIDMQWVNGKPTIPPHLRDRLVLGPMGLLEFGEPDVLLFNDGNGVFRPASWTEGVFLDDQGKPLAQAPRDWGLTATFRDLNGDGWPDLYVCNDYWTPDRIWINDGRGNFRAIDPLAIRHTSENSMGVDMADVDRDGDVDILVLDMLSRDPRIRRRQVLAQTRVAAGVGEMANRPQVMRNALFLNRGDATFAEAADYCGVAASDWSWQPHFVDVDLDGHVDVLIPAGHQRDVQDMDATRRIQSLQHPWPKSMDAQAHQQAFTREFMEHIRMYPRLPMPIVAYRNTGNLGFEETTLTWGTADAGVHQGMAMGDFDLDGDLDFVVNNLNGVCGLYRNETSAPRVVVRLRGRPPNTEAIGAMVTLAGATVARQSQEVVAGGRYLSGSEPLMVFGVGGKPGAMSLQVLWRSGLTSAVEAVQLNRLYEIHEPESPRAGETFGRTSASDAAKKADAPLFVDVSDRLKHVHHEPSFDDYARQPLLPRRLSHLGPGVAWFDVDGDGHDDLLVGSGRQGSLSVSYGDGRGGFRATSHEPFGVQCPGDQTGMVGFRDGAGRRRVLVGVSNYEEGTVRGGTFWEYGEGVFQPSAWEAGGSSSSGPLAVADLDGDGDLDLFVGGRVNPGRYPEPATSWIWRSQGQGWEQDHDNGQVLSGVGLVSGAVWSDLDGDGYPELVLACEWGPIRVFRNQAGRLADATREWGLEDTRGWWNSVAAGDFDGDGRMDLVAGNWGLNSPYVASPEAPLGICYGDYMKRGLLDVIEVETDRDRGLWVPFHRLDYMAAGLPWLVERFQSHRRFGEATIDEVLGDKHAETRSVRVERLASMVFLNRGSRLERCELPVEAQLAPVHGVAVGDLNGDGREDVFLSQNSFVNRWEMPRQDAGRGLWLRGDGRGGFEAVDGQVSGIEVYGDQRGTALGDFNEDGRADLVVTQNGGGTLVYQNAHGRRGLRVRLTGSAANPDGVGARLRVKYVAGVGPARELHSGSGYWSQSSLLVPLGLAGDPVGLEIRWPGGRVTEVSLPTGAWSVQVSMDGKLTVE